MKSESSGRWDATGSFQDAVWQEREKAFQWASKLTLNKLHWAITVMASDVNAFTLYERKALLEVVALKLGEERKTKEDGRSTQQSASDNARALERKARRAQDALDRDIVDRNL